jgi:putative (di)nucleoside polyphosphate hydrolase
LQLPAELSVERPQEYGLLRRVHIRQGGALLRSQPLWNNAATCVCEVVAVIDPDGFRPNVGIILTNDAGQVLWARRINQDAWQFPQGGINPDETPEDALYRELNEEVGLEREDVEILACTRGWLRYRLPQRLVRTHSQPLCIGQKQKWFLLRLISNEQRVRMDLTGKPEFDGWRWVSYWYPLGQVVTFKREVYRRALKELAPRLLTRA